MENSLFVQIKKGNSNKQIIFFPYLGGYVTAYHKLIYQLDDDINVWVADPPGHGNSKTKLVEDMTELVDMYFEEMIKIMTSECYIFGHSMGGNIGYFLARKICFSDECPVKPKALIISASAPPLSMLETNYSKLPDSEMINIIMGYGAIPSEFRDNKKMLEDITPIIRADYKILETAAEIKIDKKLNLETYLIWGELDKVEPISLLSKWLQYFDCEVTILPVKNAEHMLINSHTDIIADYIEKILDGFYIQDDDDI